MTDKLNADIAYIEDITNSGIIDGGHGLAFKLKLENGFEPWVAIKADDIAKFLSHAAGVASNAAQERKGTIPMPGSDQATLVAALVAKRFGVELVQNPLRLLVLIEGVGELLFPFELSHDLARELHDALGKKIDEWESAAPEKSSGVVH